MIAIVDYGAGNLVSVKKALDWLGKECAITSDPGEVAKAAKIVLPGVGHFASTAALERSGLQAGDCRRRWPRDSVSGDLRRDAVDVCRAARNRGTRGSGCV